MKKYIDDLTDEQKTYLTDEMYTPILYKGIVKTKPKYKGRGEHSVKELENMLEQYEEYAHQQQIIKRNCMKHLVELKFNIQID